MNINNQVIKYKPKSKDSKSAKELHRLSNCMKVLSFIKIHGSITAEQAREYLKVNRLAARIYDLKHKHKQVIDTYMHQGEKERFAIYSLGAKS
jgi:hypothetical protein